MDGLDLKILRIRVGLTLVELGKRSGNYKAPRICEMEKGYRPVAEELVELLQRELEAKGTVAQ